MNRHAYALCVLERFWRCLKRREVFAAASTRWRDPQAALLDGSRWQGMRAETLTALGLPESPETLLAGHADALDETLRRAVEEPPSLVDLRARTTAMLPRVELPEAILEVMDWVPQLQEAFTAASGARSRMAACRCRSRRAWQPTR